MDTIGELNYVLYVEVSLFKGFSKNFKYSVLMHETRPSGGARWVMVPCEPDMISNRSDVIDHGLPVVCGLYYTIQTISTTKMLYMFT